MKTFICDDNPVHRRCICKFASACCARNAMDCEWKELSPEELQNQLLSERFQADILILDINMGDYDGIQMAKQVNQAAPDCKIIFLTSYIDYAPRVYETRHLYFVLKAQMEEMLPKALAKAWNLLNQEEPCLMITVSNEDLKIPFEKILYLEKFLHYTVLTTDLKEFKVPKSLRTLEPLMGKDFVRCHGSYMVNLRRVSGHTRTKFTLDNGAEIPIGRTFQAAACDAYLDYLASLM
ncbi:MAG: LytTR family DNA-binding domain-containing protein [Lachnospiraceae bacterium]|nr:LytTR family DNA-binding domain-containing protein [Lachnospiraceae bacterium]